MHIKYVSLFLLVIFFSITFAQINDIINIKNEENFTSSRIAS